MRINLGRKQNQYYKARKLAVIFRFFEVTGVASIIYNQSHKRTAKKLNELCQQVEGPESLDSLLNYIKKTIEIRREGYR